MQFKLRAPEASDYAALIAWLPDAEACLRWAGPLVTFPTNSELLSRQLVVPGGSSYFLADSSSRPIGFGQHWVLKPSAVHLGRIIVAPTHRGQGLGRQLCVELVAQAIATTGATEVTLRVFRDNTAAWSLYQSLGFLPLAAESTEEVLFMVRDAG